MTTLVVGNTGDADLGVLAPAIGGDVRRLYREDCPDWPDDADALTGISAVVHLGSDWSVLDARVADVVEREGRLMAAAAARRLPVLAVCFGAQLAAVSGAGVVAKNPVPEIGWVAVGGCGAPGAVSGVWAQWHSDGIQQVPPGAQVLVRGSLGVDAFSWGTVMAVQFHPEASPAILARWAQGDGSPAEMAAAGTDLEQLAAQGTRHAGDAATRAVRLWSVVCERAFAQQAQQAQQTQQAQQAQQAQHAAAGHGSTNERA